MIIYHAARAIFTKPDPSFFVEERDFGPCLYTTLDIASARNFRADRPDAKYILRGDVNLDHVNYTHRWGNLNVYVFDYTCEDDIVLWMRQVIANRECERCPKYFEYIAEDIDIYAGYRADGPVGDILDRIVTNYGETALDDSDLLLDWFDSEEFQQYLFRPQIAFTAKACDALFDENINPMEFVE